ncbi:sulfide:quinone oxidoreductase, partial [Tremellales sp. Uapishka_1]
MLAQIPRTFPKLARFASTASSSKHKVVVIGGGAGGLSAANQVYNAFKSNGQTLSDGDIAIIDANQYHDYQPGWTVVGSGLADKTKFRKPLDSLIPNYLAHINESASGFEPSKNQVVLKSGSKVEYDYLIVAAGLQTNVDNIKGLSAAIADPLKSRVSTIYQYETADKTWDLIKAHTAEKGEAIFTQPSGVVKCAGAPQKIAYMADSYWKTLSTPVPHSTFMTGMPTMFAVPRYAQALNKLRGEKGIDAEFNHNLVEVKSDSAVFEIVAGERKGEKIEKEFGLLHVTPQMGPLNWIKSSPLADAVGWVDVNEGTLQHKKYDNVFALGDCSSLPTSKTAAAITAQAPVLVNNLVTLMQTGTAGTAIYDGYTSCPLFTGRGELMLAEFVYGAKPKETFGRFIDQSIPNRAFYHLTKDVFPRVYFSNMLKGNWYGPKSVFPPQFVPS